MTRVLYDGWPLLREPLSNPALHLETVLALLPDGLEPVLAFPATPPDDRVGRLPDCEVKVVTESSRRKWEQGVLPRLQSQLKIDLTHLTAETPALLGPQRAAVSPTAWIDAGGRAGSAQRDAGRLGRAMAAGGLARVQAQFWPADLSALAPANTTLLKPTVHPSFVPHEHFYPPEIPEFDLPETFVLYHGPQDLGTLRRTLEIWTWVAGPVGEVYPLLMLGLETAAQEQVAAWIPELKLEETVILPPELPSERLPVLYQACAALLHPAAVAPWGGPVRRALACHRPVVSIEHPATSAMVAAGGYLVDGADTRRLGAAMIAVIVKEPLQKQLRSAAIDRLFHWSADEFSQELGTSYQKALAH